MDLAGLTVPASRAVLEFELVVRCRMFRRAREVRLAIAPGTAANARARDPALIKLLTKAWTAREALMNGGGASLTEVAATNGCEPGYFTVLVKLGFLDPGVIAAILNDLQPETLNRQQLARMRGLPMEWDAQRRILEFISGSGSPI